eukprot:1159861-Pelagomonas_calceolata.AAC.2
MAFEQHAGRFVRSQTISKLEFIENENLAPPNVVPAMREQNTSSPNTPFLNLSQSSNPESARSRHRRTTATHKFYMAFTPFPSMQFAQLVTGISEPARLPGLLLFGPLAGMCF